MAMALRRKEPVRAQHVIGSQLRMRWKCYRLTIGLYFFCYSVSSGFCTYTAIVVVRTIAAAL
jgi:hypothetical protein